MNICLAYLRVATTVKVLAAFVIGKVVGLFSEDLFRLTPIPTPTPTATPVTRAAIRAEIKNITKVE